MHSTSGLSKAYQPVKIEEEAIETVNYFCHLGSIITTNGGSAEDITCRLNKDR